MVRSACCEKVGLKKGPWTPEEDHKLVSYIEQHGHGSWRALPSKAGLERCGKSCRLRWRNYLRPDIKRGKFSLQEERTIIQLHALLGNRWSAIAAHLAKRTDNEIKNYWNTHLKKRLTKMGIDPTTHKPKTDHHPLAGSASASSAANLSHMAQWESARLEAEARLVRDSKYASSFSDSLSRSRTTPPARLVLNRIPAAARSPCLDVLKAWQNSWSSPSVNDKNSTRVVHNMYASMLAQNDDVLESPTSTLTFPPEPPVLPPPPPRACLKDDDIMAAVEAFMGQKRYNNNDDKNLAYSNSIITTTTTTSAMEDHDVNIGGDEFEDMLVYENNSNHNLGILSEEGGGFMMSHNYDHGGNDNNIDISWNNIYTQLGESFAT